MGRNVGGSSFSGNLEVKASAPLDARLVVDSKSDLTTAGMFAAGAGQATYIYRGMLVSVVNDADATNNGVYRLKNTTHTNTTDWEKIGSLTSITPGGGLTSGTYQSTAVTTPITTTGTLSVDTNVIATRAFVNDTVATFLEDQGNYNPTGANSGKNPMRADTSASKGDIWYIDTDGLVGGNIAVSVGDSIRATQNFAAGFNRTGSDGWAISRGFTPKLQAVTDAGAVTSKSIGIGTTSINASAILDLTSTTKGFLAPRMTGAQKTAIVSPAAGLMIYNTDDLKYNYYNGTEWKEVGSGSGITSLNGLSGATQTFTNDANVTISSSGTTHTVGWSNQLSIARGGTGASTASGAFDALNPMTTVGDIIYEGTGNSATRLAGNTSTTKQFLSQTGTGSASAAPSWSQVAYTDLTGTPSTFAPSSHVLDSTTHTISGKTAGQVLLATTANAYAFTTIGGDVTVNGSGSVTIGNNAITTVKISDSNVTLAKIANIATGTILGNNSGSNAAPTALTATQATAMLNVFTSSTKGLVPSGSGGSGNVFLTGAGTWSSPAANVASNLFNYYNFI